MHKLIATIVTVAIVAAAPAAEAGASKEENIGVGSGVVIGALAGGPVGAVIGAALGAKVGDTMHRRNAAIEELSVSLRGSRSDVAGLETNVRTLNRDIDKLNAELARYEQIDRSELLSLMRSGIAMDLLFRTDEHVLADTTGDRLAKLAAGVAQMDDVYVRLDGFADERGDAGYNLELSRKRVEFVRDQLVATGIHPSRIQVEAHGESAAQDETVDSYALERRVALTLFISTDGAESLQPFAQAAN
jgi:outer membrane protein OmpA-like peptidoglycan-associated protein